MDTRKPPVMDTRFRRLDELNSQRTRRRPRTVRKSNRIQRKSLSEHAGRDPGRNGGSVIDADGTIVLISSQLEKLFGAQWDELRGSRVETLDPAEDFG